MIRALVHAGDRGVTIAAQRTVRKRSMVTSSAVQRSPIPPRRSRTAPPLIHPRSHLTLASPLRVPPGIHCTAGACGACRARCRAVEQQRRVAHSRSQKRFRRFAQTSSHTAPAKKKTNERRREKGGPVWSRGEQCDEEENNEPSDAAAQRNRRAQQWKKKQRGEGCLSRLGGLWPALLFPCSDAIAAGQPVSEHREGERAASNTEERSTKRVKESAGRQHMSAMIPWRQRAQIGMRAFDREAAGFS